MPIVSLGRVTPKKAQVIQVIHVHSTRGTGVDPDPIRRVDQYWSFDGTLLAESDCITNSRCTSAEAIATLTTDLEKAREAVQEAIYETTHLSPMPSEDNRYCYKPMIKREVVNKWREVLSSLKETPPQQEPPDGA